MGTLGSNNEQLRERWMCQCRSSSLISPGALALDSRGVLHCREFEAYDITRKSERQTFSSIFLAGKLVYCHDSPKLLTQIRNDICIMKLM